MNIKELEDKVAEIRERGDKHVRQIMADVQGMGPEEKQQYYDKTNCWQVENGIRLELEQAKQELAGARHYQLSEKDEIVKAFKETASQSGGSARSPAQNEFRNFGQFLQSIACIQGGLPISSQFNQPYREELHYKLNLYNAAASGMSVGVPSDGGYLVRKDWSAQFLQKGMDRSMLLPLCTRVGVGADFDSLEYPYIDESSRANGSRWGGVQVFWVSEAGTVTAKKPKIGKGEIRLEELMGLAYVTNRLLRDAVALQSVLSSAFESEIGFKLDDSVMRGTGSGQMLGFLNSPVLVSVTRAADDVDTVLEMFSRMPARLEAGSVWLHHKNWIKKLPKMKIGETPVWMPPGGMAAAPNATILGSPARSIEQCSAVGTAGDLILANMGEYVYIEKEGEGVAFDESIHIRFEYNEMAFRWVKRINGQPVARTSLTPYTGSDALSPFITVAA